MTNQLRNVSFFEIEVFLTLTQARSIRATARKMNLKASHVSKVVQRLEEKLGKTLLKRAPSGMLLSREGMSFQNYATRMLEYSESLLDEDESKLSVQTATRSKVVTIGAPSFINKSLVANAIGGLAKIDSIHRYRVLDVPPDKLPSVALRGGLEVIIHTDKEPWTKAWDVTLIGQLSWGLYSRTGHPLGSQAELDETLAYPFIIPTYWQDEQYAIGNDLFPVPWSQRIRGDEASTADTAARMVHATDQLAFLPNLMKRPGGEAFSLTQIYVPNLKPVTRKLYLIVKADVMPAILHKKMLAALKQFL